MKRAGLGLAVVVAIVAVYWRAVGAYFYEDDFAWLASTFTFQPVHIFDIGAYSHFYRPVIELYFWAAAPVFGGSPALFHAASIVFHVLNAVLLFLFVREATGSERYGFLSAWFFVGIPGYVEAIAWIGALAEPIGAIFGCLALWTFLRFSKSGGAAWRALSLAAFALALLTHESSVVFFPVLLLAGWAFAPARRSQDWRLYARWFWPYALFLAVYLAIDLPINARNYVVGERLYRPGLHIVQNTLRYVVTLYVGQHNLPSYVGTAAVVVMLLARGSRRVRFATCWMLLALMPFAPFTWANTSRYLYLPAMGFAMLVAELIEWIDRAAAARMRPGARQAVVGLLVAAIGVRFCLFAAEGVEHFAERTEPYRRFIMDVRARHPQLPRDASVPVDVAIADTLHHRFLQAAVQWDYRDPTIRLVPVPPDDHQLSREP
jgi:Dolichyl-phosphate-mannose-protein mannosyltransferase